MYTLFLKLFKIERMMNTRNYANCQAFVIGKRSIFSLFSFIKKSFILSLVWIIIGSSPIFGEEQIAKSPDMPVKATLVAEEESLQSGRAFWIAIRLEIDDHWHTYSKNPGPAGYPPSAEWKLPEGFLVSDIYWPHPKTLTSPLGTCYGYTKEVWLLCKITPPPLLKEGTETEIHAQIQWLACSDSTCLPGTSDVKVLIPVKKEEPKVDNRWIASFADAREKIGNGGAQEEIALNDNPKPTQQEEVIPNNAPNNEPIGLETFDSGNFSGGMGLALAFAFLGGLLLNLMPCVLPVVSLKVLSFVKMSGQKRSRIFQHGVFFSLGVMLSFWGLAGILLGLQAYGEAVGWGFQLQEPIFVAFLAAIILVISLNLFGLFEFGTLFSSWAGQTQSDYLDHTHGLVGSFLSGVLATAVATPCTGPFLGSSLGFAMTLAPLQALLVFTALGFGMTLPYLLLTAFPQLLRWIPKPGAWMVTFKEIMGFLMLATALWLVWVFGAETSLSSVIILLIGFLLLSIACWVFGKWCGPARKMVTRVFGYLLTAAFCFAGGYAILYSISFSENKTAEHGAVAMAYVNASKTGKHEWENYSYEKVQGLRNQNVPVFVDFTARWCLICQTNFIVLSTGEVHKKMKQMGVIKMEADWTKSDPAITEELRKFGRNGVPLYLLYGPDPSIGPYILPQVLTPEIVMAYLEKIEVQRKSLEKRKKNAH